MGDIRLPRWIIAAKTLPGGSRQSKKPKFIYPVDEVQKSAWERAKAMFHRGASLNPQAFDKMEYRFWAADLKEDGTPNIVECRACSSMIMTKIHRAVHLSERGCAKRLVAAYKLLLRDQLCVICNQKTKESRWGVPLCSEGCQQRWCEEDAQPKPLYEALALVRDVH